MSDRLLEVRGFDELKQKIKSLANDKVKRKEINKILRLSAKSTIDAARQEAPQSDEPHTFRGGKVFRPGNLKKSIRAATLRRSRVPMVVVGPRSTGKYDGFYGRSFVIPGHRTRSGRSVAPNEFMQRGFDRTRGQVTAKMVKRTERYIQKQIDRL